MTDPERQPPGERWQIGSRWRLDGANRTLHGDERLIGLPPRALDLLIRLARAEGQLITKDVLLNDVWSGRVVEEGTLSRHVWILRKALGQDADLLETVPKAGYRLLSTVLAQRTTERATQAEPGIGVPTQSTAGAPPARNIGLLASLLAFAFGTWLVTNHSSMFVTDEAPQVEAAKLLQIRADALVAQRAEADITEATRLYRQAVELDPDNADLWAGLARSIALNSGVALPASSYEAARGHAQRALERDPQHVEALCVLGLVAMNHDRDWNGAQALFRRALSLDSESVRAHHWLGELLVLMGEPASEGLQHLAQAHALAPQSVAIASDLAKAAYFSRLYERAVAAANAAIEIDHGFAHSWRWRGLAQAELGQCVQGTTDLRAADRLDPNDVVRGELIYGLGRCGATEQARRLRDELERRASGTYVSPVALLLARVGVGDRAAAMQALETAYAQRGMMLGLSSAPALDSLRDLPRFHEIEQALRADTQSVSDP